ncbi:MAG: hypothetical protein CRU72_12720 [Candidatus Accumulibacter phosphatis]|nr:hypothetical protein [Candidatus Accumulibacter phosphatis]
MIRAGFSQKLGKLIIPAISIGCQSIAAPWIAQVEKNRAGARKLSLDIPGALFVPHDREWRS